MKNKVLLLIAVVTLGLTATTLAQVPSYVPSNGLVGYWPFNGNANDESGNGNNGTVNGATLTTDRNGNANSAYQSGQLTPIISIPNISINSSLFTCSYWIKYSSQPINTSIADVSHEWLNNGTFTTFRQLNSTLGFASVGSTGISNQVILNSPNPINTQVWNHIIIMRTNQIMQIWINGIYVASDSLVQIGSLINTKTLYLGGDPQNTIQNPSAKFNGNIDDVGIWNRVLTQQEITDLYNGCQLTVNTQPVSQTININNNAQFIVGSSDPNATYQWQTDLGVGFQNVSNAGQYNGTSNDTLSVANVSMSNNNQSFRCIINSGSCADTSNVAVLTINNNVGIHEMAQHNLFSVFPNPAHNVINVKADHTLIGSVFTIYDNTGKAVQSGKINAANTSIELSNLSTGFYMFSLGENRKQSFKIIKE
jgi:hypothetical protein